MNSHLDKVKLFINETMESVANRFVEITKAYKSFVIDDFLAYPMQTLISVLPKKTSARTGNCMVTLTVVKKCQLELVFRAGLSKEGTISGISPFIRWLLVVHYL
jgi:hypothetical protein